MKAVIFATILLFSAQCLAKEGVIVFHATWCGPCKKLERTTLQNKDVKEALKKFDYYKFDVDRDKIWRDRYNVTRVPTIIRFERQADGRAKIIQRETGYLNKAQFLEFLKKEKE